MVDWLQVRRKSIFLSRALRETCERRRADCVLLSGGVDSSLLAFHYRIPCVTVVLEDRGHDAEYSQIVAELLGVDWYLIRVDRLHAVSALLELMVLQSSFDSGIFNDLPVYIALRYACERGWRRVVSGEGAELLFAGYGFVAEKGLLFREYREAALAGTRLSETEVGRALNRQLVYPYLDDQVVDAALAFDIDECLSNRIYAAPVVKVPLRIAAERLLPGIIAWRPRADLEQGSGFNSLGPLVVAAGKQYPEPVEHAAHYYDDVHKSLHRIFCGLGLGVRPAANDEYRCLWCGGGVRQDSRHCRSCGAYPANQGRFF